MEELYDYRQRLLERYEGILMDLTRTLEGIPMGEWHVPVEPRGWSIHQIAAHLRDREAQAFLPRIERILNEDIPYLEEFDDLAWMQAHYRRSEPLEAILNDYIHLRNQELAWIRDPAVVDWNRQGRHPWWGLRTLQWWVEASLAHAEEHLQELNEKFLAVEQS